MKNYLLLLLLLAGPVVLHAQPAPAPAGDVLQEACREAAAAKKNVFLIFHASWCGWCHKMDTAMNDPACKQLFRDHYVIAHLTVLESKEKKQLENPGAEAMLDKYKGKEGGIPFWLIFDGEGRLLADSHRPEGTARINVGCPAAPEELAYFTAVLKKTSNLTADELKVIQERFAKEGTMR